MAVRRLRGITLIELLTVIVVLALLASLAVPSYRRYVQRAQRTDASTALLRIAGAQEKFFLQNNRYTDDLASAQADGGLGTGEVSEQGRYDLAIELDVDVSGTAAPGGYRATATPRAGGGQTDDARCQLLAIDHAGARRGEDSSGGDRTDECWR
jgi:type IV pilus assembly protein PilE